MQAPRGLEVRTRIEVRRCSETGSRLREMGLEESEESVHGNNR
jgi:hypothetical protein